MARLLLKLDTNHDESPLYISKDSVWKPTQNKSRTHLPFWTDPKDGMEKNQIFERFSEDFAEPSFLWGLNRPVVSRTTMKEHAVMGAASAAVRMNLTPLAAGSDELMNLKTSVTESNKPKAAKVTDPTREMDNACSNQPDNNSGVSLDKAAIVEEKGMTDTEP